MAQYFSIKILWQIELTEIYVYNKFQLNLLSRSLDIIALGLLFWKRDLSRTFHRMLLNNQRIHIFRNGLWQNSQNASFYNICQVEQNLTTSSRTNGVEVYMPWLIKRSTHLRYTSQRWPPIQAISRDPTLIFLWTCSPKRVLQTSKCQLPRQSISWENAKPEKPHFHRKPVFQRTLLNERNNVDGWNFQETYILQCSLYAEGFRLLYHSNQKLWSTQLTKT